MPSGMDPFVELTRVSLPEFMSCSHRARFPSRFDRKITLEPSAEIAAVSLEAASSVIRWTGPVIFP